MNVVAQERTIDVCLLGRRGRYSLTPLQQCAYIALVRFHDEIGHMPTIVEWMARAGIHSTTDIQKCERALEERGWIRTQRMAGGQKQKRGIELLEPVLRHLKPCVEAR